MSAEVAGRKALISQHLAVIQSHMYVRSQENSAEIEDEAAALILAEHQGKLLAGGVWRAQVNEVLLESESCQRVQLEALQDSKRQAFELSLHAARCSDAALRQGIASQAAHGMLASRDAVLDSLMVHTAGREVSTLTMQGHLLMQLFRTLAAAYGEDFDSMIADSEALQVSTPGPSRLTGTSLTFTHLHSTVGQLLGVLQNDFSAASACLSEMTSLVPSLSQIPDFPGVARLLTRYTHLVRDLPGIIESLRSHWGKWSQADRLLLSELDAGRVPPSMPRVLATDLAFCASADANFLASWSSPSPSALPTTASVDSQAPWWSSQASSLSLLLAPTQPNSQPTPRAGETVATLDALMCLSRHHSVLSHNMHTLWQSATSSLHLSPCSLDPLLTWVCKCMSSTVMERSIAQVISCPFCLIQM